MFDAILFVQLGSPENATPASVEKYLVEFLGDWHTLGNPPFFWKPLLKNIIAPKRSRKSAGKYRDMVDASGLGEMPLIHHTRNFAQGIAEAVGEEIPVRFAFEFGSRPSIADSLDDFCSMGKRNIRVIPLYPQRSLVTTVAVRDLALAAFKKFPSMRMHFVDGFPMNAVYLEETLKNVLNVWDGKCPVVFSFHGTPEKWVRQGDPYHLDCEREFSWFRSRLLRKNPGAEIFIAYQSRFGPVKWLGPFTRDVVARVGKSQKDVLIACPSFTADNLETLYEVDVELGNLFKASGGGRFLRVPCLNANRDWTARFAKEVLREDGGASL